MILPQACPWKDHFFTIEADVGKEGQIKYALYGDTRGDWMVHSVPVTASSFDNRAPLPGKAVVVVVVVVLLLFRVVVCFGLL
jgi:uncharacterized UPF0160 family protein